MKITAQFVLARETKNCYRYEELDTNGLPASRDEATFNFGSFYIPKQPGLTAAQVVTLTIEEAKQ